VVESKSWLLRAVASGVWPMTLRPKSVSAAHSSAPVQDLRFGAGTYWSASTRTFRRLGSKPRVTMEHRASQVERDGAVYRVEARPLLPLTFPGGFRETRLARPSADVRPWCRRSKVGP
jgi:hypothetical protein